MTFFIKVIMTIENLLFLAKWKKICSLLMSIVFLINKLHFYNSTFLYMKSWFINVRIFMPVTITF